MNDLGTRAGQLEDQFGEFANGELDRIAEIDRTNDFRPSLHHGDQTADQIVDIAE